MDGAKFQPAAARRLWTTVRRSESGQTLIEVLIASGIFAIVAASLIYLLTSTVNISSLSRQKTLAQQLAASEIDYIRNLPYTSVGNVSGNPSGSIPLTQSVNISGASGATNATETTRISYVNDPTPLSYQSLANYKQVTVTITRSDGTQLAREVTNIAPPIKASQSQGAILVTVVDTGNNTVVPNATVNIANGPSGSESDVTNVTGKVTFAGLLPTTTGQPNYDVTVTPPSGYVALKDTQPPNTVAHFPLSPGQTQPAAIQIYQPVTIYVQLLNFDGTAYTGSANITVTSSRGTQSFAYSSPQTAITALGTEPLVPGLNYTVAVAGGSFYGNSTTASVPANNYPTNLSSTFAFTNAQLATVTVAVKNKTGGNCTSGSTSVTITGGPWSLSGSTALTTGVSAGVATFTSLVPVGTSYAITAKNGATSVASTTTAVVAGTNTANPIQFTTLSSC
jgi:type II secretory pathway pseudopilin PulG